MRYSTLYARLRLLALLLLLLELHLHDLNDALDVLLLALDRLLERGEVGLHKVGLALVVRRGLCAGLLLAEENTMESDRHPG